MNEQEKPRVVVIEDNVRRLAHMLDQLKIAGCNILGTATSVPAAIELINEFATLKPSFVLLDGNLGRSPQDGAKLIELIRQQTNAKVIGISENEQPYVDTWLGKQGFLASYKKDKLKSLFFPE